MDSMLVYRALCDYGRVVRGDEAVVSARLANRVNITTPKAQLAIGVLERLGLLKGEKTGPRVYRSLEAATPTAASLRPLSETERGLCLAIVLRARRLVGPNPARDEMARAIRELIPGVASAGLDIGALATSAQRQLPK